MANISWTKHDIDNRAKAFDSTKGLLRCPKVSWTLVHKRLKPGPQFLPTLTISFCRSPSHTLYAVLTWRPTASLNETALGSYAAQIWSPRRCKIGNAIASGGLKWQHIAIIATFLVSLCKAWQWCGMQNLRRVGDNSPPIWSRLWTKVHVILSQCIVGYAS